MQLIRVLLSFRAAGDFLAQRAHCLGRERKLKYNYRRTAFTAAYGGGLMGKLFGSPRFLPVLVYRRQSVIAGPLGHFWYQKLDQVASSCLRPSTASFVAAKVLS